jgi:hypothetical protein
VSKLPIPRRVASRPQLNTLPKRPEPQRAVGRVSYKTRTVGALVPNIAKKVFEKFGFSTATLLTDWAIIVGADLAAYTAPERLKWSRGYDSAASGEVETGRPGATLMLRVEPARALDIQYKARLLIDRINAYFGYRAVAEIRLIQAPLLRPAAPAAKRSPAAPLPPQESAVTAVDDAELRSALAGLEASIRAQRDARRA